MTVVVAAHPHEPVAFVDLVDLVGHDGHDEALLVVAAHHLLPQLLHPLLGPLERVLPPHRRRRRHHQPARPDKSATQRLRVVAGDERTGSVAS